MIRLLTLLILLSAVLAGCQSGMAPAQIQTAQVSFDKALEFESNGNSAEALTAIEEALKTGGLNPDLLGQAYLLRSRCKSRSGDAAGAEADLALAEQGSPSDALFSWTKGVLHEAKGETSQAKSEFAKAKKLDPTLKI